MYLPPSDRAALPADLARAAEIPLSDDLLVQSRSRGLSLTDLLEELDPSSNESPLDAFERQLALAGIRVSGPYADSIDRFFASTESSVLFPEFVSRSIRTGKTEFRSLDRILATRTRIDSDVYKTLYLDESAWPETERSLARVGEGAELPKLEIRSAEHAVRIRKFGRYLEVSYEALRRKTTSIVSVFLQAIGYQIEKDKFAEAVGVLVSGDGNDNAATTANTAVDGTLAYNDLVDFALAFQPYQLNVIVASPAVVKTILTLSEFKDPAVCLNLLPCFEGKGDRRGGSRLRLG